MVKYYFLIFPELYSPFTLNGHVFTQILNELFCSPKNKNFSDKFYSICKRLLFPATLISALVIHIQIVWLLCCFTKNNYIWRGAMSNMNLLRNLKMRKYVSIFYPTRKPKWYQFSFLNKLVFTVTACCLKNISIHNLDRFVELSGRNSHDNCSNPKAKKNKMATIFRITGLIFKVWSYTWQQLFFYFILFKHL